MEKLSKEQIVSSANKWFEDFLNENYYEKFKDMDENEAYRLSRDILKDVKEAGRSFFFKTCKNTIIKTCDCTVLESDVLNGRNVTNYCDIVGRYILAKVVDGYLKAFVENYETQYDELDESIYKWYDEELECDLPYEIICDYMEYVYIPRLEWLTDCRYVFVYHVPYDETHLSGLLNKLSDLLHDYGCINAPYYAVMAKEID